MMRTNYCGELNRSHVGQNVTLSGWVHRVRNLGRFIFMQIRDREGIVQVFFDEKDETIEVAATAAYRAGNVTPRVSYAHGFKAKVDGEKLKGKKLYLR